MATNIQTTTRNLDGRKYGIAEIERVAEALNRTIQSFQNNVLNI
jgi:hypothetical protein